MIMPTRTPVRNPSRAKIMPTKRRRFETRGRGSNVFKASVLLEVLKTFPPRPRVSNLRLFVGIIFALLGLCLQKGGGLRLGGVGRMSSRLLCYWKLEDGSCGWAADEHY